MLHKCFHSHNGRERNFNIRKVTRSSSNLGVDLRLLSITGCRSSEVVQKRPEWFNSVVQDFGRFEFSVAPIDLAPRETSKNNKVLVSRVGADCQLAHAHWYIILHAEYT